MNVTVPCFVLKYGDHPELIGEVSEIEDLISILFGDPFKDIADGTTFTVEFRTLSEQQYNELPEWSP